MDDTAASGASATVAAVSSGRLGERVRDLRRGRGLTLNGLAELSGVSRAMISKLERGEKNPTLVVAAKLAEGLGVTLSRLAGWRRGRVAVVARERRMIMRDPETDSSGSSSHRLRRARRRVHKNKIPKGSTSGDFPPHRRGVEEHVVVNGAP